MKIFLSLFLIFASFEANACGCDNPKTIEDLRFPSIVFEGKVIDIKKHKRSGKMVIVNNEFASDFSTQEITFKIRKQYQGKKMRRIVVSFNEGGSSSCDLQKLTFKKGDIYLISTVSEYPPEKPGGKPVELTRFSNNFCNLRKHLTTQSR